MLPHQLLLAAVVFALVQSTTPQDRTRPSLVEFPFDSDHSSQSHYIIPDSDDAASAGSYSASPNIFTAGQLYMSNVVKGWDQFLKFVENRFLIDVDERIQSEKTRIKWIGPSASLNSDQIGRESKQDSNPNSHIVELASSGSPVMLQKRQTDNNTWTSCSGVGWEQNSTEPAFSCNGTIKAQSALQSGIDIPCSSCDPANTTCTTSCCTPATAKTTYCSCPADRSGESCEIQRKFSCNFTLLSPNLTCSLPNAPAGIKIYSDPSCIKFKQTDNVTISLNLNCKMDEPLNINVSTDGEGTPPNYRAGNFSYFARRGNEFALSTNPFLTLTSRIFNFYSLSDVSQMQYIFPNATQYLGIQPIELTFDLSKITGQEFQSVMNGKKVMKKKYLTGGRVYLEIGFFDAKFISMFSNYSYFRTFLDFSDLPTTPPPDQLASGLFENSRLGTKLNGGTIAIIVLAVL
ncbi:hypothetical protein BKA69DRAFT_1162824 [Paraphysoderma sedebokerense]|nr:hypothetical protein BKA69DRAFT_1162824 [Paraphysoderma sedebokerense]